MCIIVYDFVTSKLGQSIFKCALAYLLGSMATFIPALSGLFGQSDSKHLVATITVYFHPARSLGSMLEALMLAFAAFLYTSVVSVVSMSVAAFFDDTVHLIVLGHIIVLFLFVGGGLGFIAWVKLKRGSPLVNIACSLTSLSLITILTKEGAVQIGDYSFEKISQILRMLIAGVIATTIVSFLIFPISARINLKQNMVEVTDSLADMLALITSSFISGDENELDDPVLTSVSERHRKTFASITQHLKESNYEHYLLGTEVQVRFEQSLAKCIQQITQSVGGLRSAAAMQFVVVKQPSPADTTANSRHMASYASLVATPSLPTAHIDRQGSDYMRLGKSDNLSASQPNVPSEEDSVRPLRTPSQIFDLFMDHLGPSMRSLAYTLKEILDDLPFDAAQDYRVSVHPKFKASLERALELYLSARDRALEAVYDKKDLDRRRPFEVEADWEEAAACCGHFSFSLLEVAEDVKNYLDILDEMQLELEEQPSGRSWSWLKFWNHEPASSFDIDEDPDADHFSSQLSNLELQTRTPEAKIGAVNAAHDGASTWNQIKLQYFQQLHDQLAVFRREDVKYAIKVGFGAILFALPSFIPSTRPFYSHWRGEWGLLSYMLVCSMTIGASNTTGYSRVLGTCLGAILAIAAWHISGQNPIALAILGFCMAYWTAYIIVGKGKGPMGRFIMLTYNLSALYAYSLSVMDDDPDKDEEDDDNNPLVFNIAIHRVVAVLSGCLWGLIITRLVWPIRAREKLKAGLSLLWLRMGLIWRRDPLTILTEGAHSNRYMNLGEEFELQRFLSQLQALVDAAKSEFELRGPFPHQVYSEILKSTRHMLDAFHEMNVVILKDLRATHGEEALLKATAKERTQLCARISHLFSVLASSMKMEYPLAVDALPRIDHTRDRLLAAIFTYRKANAESGETKDEDFGILYTYALVTGQLALEIEKVQTLVESLFGVLDEEALRLQ